jgi:hypothetical protein
MVVDGANAVMTCGGPQLDDDQRVAGFRVLIRA